MNKGAAKLIVARDGMQLLQDIRGVVYCRVLHKEDGHVATLVVPDILDHGMNDMPCLSFDWLVDRDGHFDFQIGPVMMGLLRLEYTVKGGPQKKGDSITIRFSLDGIVDALT